MAVLEKREGYQWSSSKGRSSIHFYLLEQHPVTKEGGGIWAEVLTDLSSC